VADFLVQYGLFLAKAVTVLTVVVLIVGVIFSAKNRGKKQEKGHLTVRHLNDEYDDLKSTLEENILDKEGLKEVQKAYKKEEKEKNKAIKIAKANKEEYAKKRIFVVDFNGDVKASGSQELAEEITAILTMATSRDEVVVRLESPGGMVHAYGLTASQLERVKKKGIALTIAVDHVAASGGYMMACLANKIIAAPFAILGSIGVPCTGTQFSSLVKKI
jgi:serine protease SohB